MRSADTQRILDLYTMGWSAPDLAVHFGVKVHTVEYMVARARIGHSAAGRDRLLAATRLEWLYGPRRAARIAAGADAAANADLAAWGRLGRRAAA